MNSEMSKQLIELGWAVEYGTTWITPDRTQAMEFDEAVIYELKKTFEERHRNKVFTDCLNRALILWKKENPNEHFWPDGAVNMAWLMDKVYTLEKKSEYILQCSKCGGLDGMHLDGCTRLGYDRIISY